MLVVIWRPIVTLQADIAVLANKRLGDLYAGLGSDQLALGYYAKALEAPIRAPATMPCAPMPGPHAMA